MPEFLTPTKRSRRVRLILPALVILAFVCGAYFVLRPPATKMAWLKPEEFTRLSALQPKSRFKDLLARLSSLLKFRHYERQIRFQFALAELPPPAAVDLGLRQPYAVSSDGLRAWIVAPRDLAELGTRLQAIPGGTNLCSTTASTYENGQITQLLQNFVAHPRGTKAFAGLDINLRASTIRNSANMLMGITEINLSADIPPVEQTNLFLACQTYIPSESGLVLLSKDGRLLIVSPRLVESGNE